MLYLFGRRLGYSFQRVRNVQVLPFIYSQRVIGQHFNLFNVVQRGYKCTQAVQILVVIGNRRHKNVPYPDGFANFRQVSCTVQNVVVGPASQLFMLIRINVLDVEKQQIGIFHQFFELLKENSCAPERLCRRVETGIYALRLCLAEELNEEVYLQQSLSPTHRYAALRALVDSKANGFRQQFVCRHQLVGMAVPCVRVMTITATHGATL